MDYDLIVIILLTVVTPIWLVLHYVAKFKTAKSLSRADEAILADLWQLATQLEDRIENLEAILDEEVPGWRRRS